MSAFTKGNIVSWIGTKGVRTGRKLKGTVECNNGSSPKVKISSYNKNNNGNDIFNQTFRNTHPFLEVTREKLQLAYDLKIKEILDKILGNKIPRKNGKINNTQFRPMLKKTMDNLVILNQKINKNINIDKINKDKYKTIIEKEFSRIDSYLEFI